MESISKHIQLQYQGYLNTPLLWQKHSIYGLAQLELPDLLVHPFNKTISENLLLGKRVEQFVIDELQQHKNIKILLENFQIQNKKITIGEIDCLLQQDDIPIHLEIIYKFYLFDANLGNSEIDQWTGPNRKDTLVQKLNKLRDKQLPVLYNEHAKPFLERLHIHSDDVLQRVLFKAQLFVPYRANINFELINRQCLKGFYIHYSETQQFSNCKFHIPVKVDWLLEAHGKVNWISYDQFIKRISPGLNEKKAPLCWIKSPNGNIQKFFVVWWTSST